MLVEAVVLSTGQKTTSTVPVPLNCYGEHFQSIQISFFPH